MARILAALALAVLAGLGTLGAGAASYAAGPEDSAGPVEARIDYVEPTEEGLQVLVSVPPGAEVDLDAVSVSIDGSNSPARAERTGATSAVARTTVLAIDTSMSMRGARFDAAREAATTFLDTVPDDVRVGIVTFDSDVEEALAPTTDRDAARAVVDGLELSLQTMLYDGVIGAVEALGTEGQRTVLVLSDGADTSETELSEVTAAIGAAEVLVDVVALEQSGEQVRPLAAMAGAGEGRVIRSDAEALRRAFEAQAQALGRQVLVTAAVPDSVTAEEASIVVSLPTADGDSLSVEAYAPVQGAGSPAFDIAADTASLTVPRSAMYVGVAALGLGLLVLVVALVPRSAPREVSAEDRVVDWTRQATRGTGAVEEARPRVDTEAALTQATDATASMLRRNRDLEARIAHRLEGAGSGFKPAEWVLLQLAVFLVSGLVGLLLGGGSLVFGLLFLIGGAVVPWLWLGVQKSRRLKAFNAALPDTLSLMSGSLAAGLSLAQSVDTIVREGTEPVASEFKRVLVETRLGVPLEDALEGITERFDSKDFAWVVMAIKIQRQVGGNLAELLDTVAGTMREREYLRRQVQSLSAEGRLSAYVLGGLPPVFLLYLFLTQRDYVMPLFTEPMGWIMLIGAAVLLSIGSFWMGKIVKVEV